MAEGAQQKTFSMEIHFNFKEVFDIKNEEDFKTKV